MLSLLCLMGLYDGFLYSNNPDPFAWMTDFVLIFSFIHQNAPKNAHTELLHILKWHCSHLCSLVPRGEDTTAL